MNSFYKCSYELSFLFKKNLIGRLLQKEREIFYPFVCLLNGHITKTWTYVKLEASRSSGFPMCVNRTRYFSHPPLLSSSADCLMGNGAARIWIGAHLRCCATGWRISLPWQSQKPILQTALWTWIWVLIPPRYWFSSTAHLGREKRMIVHIIGSLQPMWETLIQVNALTSALSSPGSCPVLPLRRGGADRIFSLLSFPLLYFSPFPSLPSFISPFLSR